jgi:hypothetical protein
MFKDEVNRKVINTTPATETNEERSARHLSIYRKHRSKSFEVASKEIRDDIEMAYKEANEDGGEDEDVKVVQHDEQKKFECYQGYYFFYSLPLACILTPILLQLD